jgi:hypothetical protein
MVKPMTPAELSASLDAINWRPATLAEVLGVNERSVRRWLAGDAAVSDPVAAWLRDLASAHRRHPPPQAPERLGPGRPSGAWQPAPRPTPKAAR